MLGEVNWVGKAYYVPPPPYFPTSQELLDQEHAAVTGHGACAPYGCVAQRDAGIAQVVPEILRDISQAHGESHTEPQESASRKAATVPFSPDK